MSMTSCPECSSKVSTEALACPSCGYPIARKELIQKASSTLKRVFSSGETPAPQTGLRYLIAPEKADYLISKVQKGWVPSSLTRINGIGFHVGSVKPIVIVDGKAVGIAMLSFTVLFLPLIPVGWRLVEQAGGSYRFLGKVSTEECSSAFGNGYGTSAYLKELCLGLLSIACIIGITFAFISLR